MIQQLATEAANLVREKKFISLVSAVGHLLDKRRITQNRSEIFRQIMSELGRRGARVKGSHAQSDTLAHAQQELLSEQDEISGRIEDMQMLRDARAHELRQPRSAWDPNHPENSP